MQAVRTDSLLSKKAKCMFHGIAVDSYRLLSYAGSQATAASLGAHAVRSAERLALIHPNGAGLVRSQVGITLRLYCGREQLQVGDLPLLLL